MNRRIRQRGQALLIVLVLAIMLVGFGLTISSAVSSASQRQSSSTAQLRRLYIAEAGAREAVLELSSGGDGNLGSEAAPLPFGGGSYWTSCADNGDFSYTITSRGNHSRGRRTLEVLVRERGHVFHHAIFAGNSSGALDYVLKLGGNGTEADAVNGDIYSGNDIEVWGDATISGMARATGTISGSTGETGITQPPFDFAGVNYPAICDINVTADFAGNEVYMADEAGGSAWQVPQSNPSHVFRKNPSDRTDMFSPTVKEDFFLEDPYEPVGIDITQNGSDPYYVSFNAPAGATGQSLIVYVDGNLWIDNRPTFSFSLRSVGTQGTQVTFVASGNIYFTDNIFLQNSDKDAVAFIALKDPAVADSGNIYFGDPTGGTLEHMQAFLYAENDFYDNHLDASGSKSVEVIGTMAAGNQVAINRDFASHHSKLSVTSDPRLRSGQVSLPGLPQQSQNLSYEIVTWLEVRSGQ